MDEAPSRRRLTVVSVAYPFAPISADPVGGAEQILSRLDSALVENGHRSIVIAREDSSVAGELRPLSYVEGGITAAAKDNTHAEVRRLLAEVISADRPDVVHLHGIDFASYLPGPGTPCLVTLHLPLDWYGEDALRPQRAGTWLLPVSPSQARTAPSDVELLDPIENGVVIGDSPAAKSDFALTLGRICSEKNVHEALDAARASDCRLFVAGAVFPYPEHRRYWREWVRPRLDGARRWIGRIAGRRKRRLLARAKCLLIPSRAPETSSLSAMEALAAGTPVIAYPSGALPDIVEHGRTGFLVESAAEMAEAMRSVGDIDSRNCRAAALDRFPADRMTGAYLDRYRQLAA